MAYRTIIICLLCLALSAQTGWADKYELEEKRGLLLIQDFSHWASLDYDFTHSQSIGNKTTTHDFHEAYNISTTCALIEPLLLQFNLAGSLGLEQTLGSINTQSTDVKKLNYQYSLTGTALTGSWHPVSFNSSYTTSTVSSPFTPTYTATTVSNGGQFSFQGKPVQMIFGYQNTVLDASGTSVSGSSKTETLSFAGTHAYRGFLATSVNASYSLLSGSGETTALYQAGLINTATFDEVRIKMLTSSLQWQSQSASGVPQSSVDLAERYHAALGKALSSDTELQFHDLETTDFSGDKQTSTTTSINTSLQHQLFESLTTSLTGGASVNNYLSGKEDRYAGGVSLQYRKKLTPGNSLYAGAVQNYEQISRNLASSSLDVRDQQKTVDADRNPLSFGSSGVLSHVVSVVSKNPDITYLEGRDYTVEPQARTITIVSTGTIAPGITLYITYTLTLDPSISYSTRTTALNSTLTLLDGKYGISGLFSQSTVTQLSGESQTGLYSTRNAMGRFQATMDAYSYGLEVGDFAAGPTVYDYADLSGLYKLALSDALLNFVAKARYTQNGASGSLGAYAQKTFSVAATYTRLFALGRGVIATNYSGSRGGTQPSDYFYLNGTFTAQINNLALRLTGQTTYRIRGNDTTMDNSAHVSLVRYF